MILGESVGVLAQPFAAVFLLLLLAGPAVIGLGVERHYTVSAKLFFEQTGCASVVQKGLQAAVSLFDVPSFVLELVLDKRVPV